MAPLDSARQESERGLVASIVIPLRPASLNAERSGHWRTRHHATAEWRQMAHLVSTGRTEYSKRVEPIRHPVSIVAHPVQKGRLMDAGNCYPSVKAAIDGLRDAQVIVDDDPRYVHSLELRAPRRPSAGEIEHLRLDIFRS